MLAKVTAALDGKINLAKLVQLSMDGPAVNHKFHRLLTEELASTVSPGFKLIDISSCGLHTVHNAFKAGHIASTWDLGSFFSALTWLFKDTPARREDFQDLTDCPNYPLEYCSHRWVENIRVAERALAVWPYVQKFLQHLMKNNKPIKTKSFETLVAAMADPLLEAKVENFISVAKLLQPFLVRYQTEAPLFPFLAKDLFLCATSLLQRFLTPDAEAKCKTIPGLLKFDFSDKKQFVKPGDVDIGFKSKQLLKSATKASQKDVLSFKIEARNFLVATLQKLVDKSPLKSKILRNLSWLNPEVLRNNQKAAVKMFEETLSHLVSLSRLDAEEVDNYKGALKVWLSDVGILPTFDSSVDRLDTYFHGLFSSASDSSLWNFIKPLLVINVISHGQAQMERGFSMNRETMVMNMGERSAISKRVVCDHVAAVCDVKNVLLNAPLLAAVSSSRASYRHYLEV